MNVRICFALLLLCLTGCGVSEPANGPVRGKPIDPQMQAQADREAAVDGLQSQVQHLAAQVEDLNQRVKALQGSGAASLPELSKRIQKVEGAVRQMGSQLGVDVDGQQMAAPAETEQPQGPAPKDQAGPRPAPQQPGQSARPANLDPAEALYAKGKQAFQARDYSAAASLLSDVATSYPKHALAADASFLAGEAYFQKGNWGQAALSYDTVIKKFPKNPKVPASMLKMGMAFQKMNKKDAARYEFQALIKQFPNSAEARQAQKFIK